MKMTTWGVTLLILAAGCKKAATDEPAPVTGDATTQKAKAWFEKQQRDPVTANKASTALLQFGNEQLRWEKTVRYPSEGILVVPADPNAGKISSVHKTSRLLVMEEDAGGDIRNGYYLYVLATGRNIPLVDPALLSGKKSPEHFTGALIRYDLSGNFISSAHYEDGKLSGKQDKLATQQQSRQSNDPGGNILPTDCSGEATCIDWYWQTYVNGVLVYEEYLYTTCQCGTNAPGGDAQQQCQNALNQMIGNTHAASELTGVETVEETPTLRRKKYKWICLKNLTWAYESTDYGTHKYMPTPSPYTPDWEWVSFEHHGINYQGVSYGGTVSDAGVVADATVGKYHAIMSLDITLKYDIICQYIPLPATYITYPCHKGFNVDSPGQIVQQPTD